MPAPMLPRRGRRSRRAAAPQPVLGKLAGIGALAGYQTILRVGDLSAAADAEALRDRSPGALRTTKILGGPARELALCLGRRRSERGPGRDIGPRRLHHRLEDRDRNAAAGCAAAKRAPLAAGIVVAEPDRNRHLVAEAHEPGIVLVVGGAGLAGDVG